MQQAHSNSRRFIAQVVSENIRNYPHPDMRYQYCFVVGREGSHTSAVWNYCHIINQFTDPLYKFEGRHKSGSKGVYKWVCLQLLWQERSTVHGI